MPRSLFILCFASLINSLRGSEARSQRTDFGMLNRALYASGNVRSESSAGITNNVHPSAILASLLLASNPSLVRTSVFERPSMVGSRLREGVQRVDAQMLAPAEAIDLGVKIATFAPQYLWLLMILAPNRQFTRKIMLPLEPIAALSLVHLAIVFLAASQDQGTAPIEIFNEVFDPSTNQLDGMEKLFAYRNFVAEEWPHVLIWDLFVGRFIWLDGLRRGIFTPHSVLLTNLIGPPGLLLHFLTCAIVGKGLPREEAPDVE